MSATHAYNWWIFALRGMIAVLFGFAAPFLHFTSHPTGILGSAMLGVGEMLLVTAYILVDGIFALAAAVANRVSECRRWMLLEGIAGIIAGVLIWAGPNPFYVIAGWLISRGIFEIEASTKLGKEIGGEQWLFLSGVASAVFGPILMTPASSDSLWLIGVYAIVFGVFMVQLALSLRNANEHMTGRVARGA